MNGQGWVRSFRVQLAVVGFALIYVAVLVLFGVTYLTEEESVGTTDGGTVTTRSGHGFGWTEIAVIALAPVALSLAWWWAGRAVRPIERIRSVAQRIEATDLSARIDMRTGPQEMVALADSFDAMLARLHDAATRQQQLLDEVSHELRTPIAVLITNADVRLARTDPDLDWYRDGLEQSRRTAERMHAILERLLLDARSYARSIDRHPADLMDVVRGVVSDMAVVAEAREVTLQLTGPASVTGSWDTTMIARAITNLVDNAVRHSPSGADVDVRVSTTDDGVHVAVSDHGPGVPASELASIFERSWQGDEQRSEGRGLGLAIAQQVGEAHGGQVSVQSPGPEGYATTFTLTIR